MELVYNVGDRVLYMGHKVVIAYKGNYDIIIEFLDEPKNIASWAAHCEACLARHTSIGTGRFAYASVDYLQPLNELYPIWN